MTPHDLLANFETLSDAPNGIQRLRELVLELAVRGKLVEQDSADEPASELLKRIQKEKAHPSVVRTRKSKEQSEQEDATTQPPFDVPTGWIWCRLLDVCLRVHYGYTAPSTNIPTHIRLVRITDIQDGKVVWEQVPGCAIPEEDAYGFLLNPRDILIARTGGTIGKTFLVGEVPRLAVFASYLIRAIPCSSVHASYLKQFCESPTYWKQLRAGSMGTGQPNVNASTLSQLWIPFPPEAEQRRIVARVDELMALLDRLEAKRQEREAARTAARNSALAALREAPTPEDVETAWLRIQDRFHELFATPEDVEPLRQAILQLAIRGRLVAQDSGDEPVHEMIDQLHQKKTRLIKEGSARAGITSLPVSSEEAPFELPYGWAWLRMEDICVIKGGVTKGRSLQGRDVVDLPYLRVANVQAGRVDLRVMKTINLPVDELEEYRLESGDVLLTEGGDWDKLGRSAVWAREIDPCIYQNHIFRARPLDERVQSRWISRFTNSPDGRAHFQSCAKRTTNLASINMTQLKNCPIPMPPPQEQVRILLHLGELMAKLDRLEDALEIEAERSSAFAAAAVHHFDA